MLELRGYTGMNEDMLTVDASPWVQTEGKNKGVRWVGGGGAELRGYLSMNQHMLTAFV